MFVPPSGASDVSQVGQPEVPQASMPEGWEALVLDIIGSEEGSPASPLSKRKLQKLPTRTFPKNVPPKAMKQALCSMTKKMGAQGAVIGGGSAGLNAMVMAHVGRSLNQLLMDDDYSPLCAEFEQHAFEEDFPDVKIVFSDGGVTIVGVEE